MTICIGTLCSDGKKAILASDRMITVIGLSHEFEHGVPKVQHVSECCLVLSAGSALLPTEIFHGFSTEFAGHRQPSIVEVVEKIKSRYATTRKKKIEEEYFRPRGLTIESFYKILDSLPPNIAMLLDSRIDKFEEWSLSLIVAGVDASGAHLYDVVEPGASSCYDELGFVCIGSGAPHAINSFIANEFTPAVQANRALFLTYEAKRRAEHAPGVGPSTDMWIVGPHSTQRIPRRTLEQLERIYQAKSSWERGKGKELERMLNRLNIPADATERAAPEKLASSAGNAPLG